MAIQPTNTHAKQIINLPITTNKPATHLTCMITTLTQAQAGTTPKANNTTMMETVEVDPTGTIKSRIKGEANTMILCPHTGVKATTMADTDHLRTETRILARSNHQVCHHHPHPQAEKAVEEALMPTAEMVHDKAAMTCTRISWQARPPVVHAPWPTRTMCATALTISTETKNTWDQDVLDQELGWSPSRLSSALPSISKLTTAKLSRTHGYKIMPHPSP
jgi:hypothetical protein